jgi:hypothetical protein
MPQELDSKELSDLLTNGFAGEILLHHAQITMRIRGREYVAEVPHGQHGGVNYSITNSQLHPESYVITTYAKQPEDHANFRVPKPHLRVGDGEQKPFAVEDPQIAIVIQKVEKITHDPTWRLPT